MLLNVLYNDIFAKYSSNNLFRILTDHNSTACASITVDSLYFVLFYIFV